MFPRREPRSDVFVPQRWVTITGKQGSLLAQDESTNLDFSDYQDAGLFVEIGAYTADQSIAIETAPAKLDGWFRPMVAINVSASTIERRVIRWSSATTRSEWRSGDCARCALSSPSRPIGLPWVRSRRLGRPNARQLRGNRGGPPDPED